MLSRKKNTVDLVMDLGTYGMRILALASARPGAISLKKCNIITSPKDFVVSTFIENPIVDMAEVRKAVKSLISGVKVTSQNLMVLLPDHSALINLIVGPPRYSKKETEEAIREDFTPIMPMPIENWHIINQSLGLWEDDEITLALAIIRQNLLEIGGIIQETGLTLQTIDLNFFNVANLIEHHLASAENKGKNIAVVHLGNETTSVGVFRDGQLRSFLNRPIGGYDFTKKISKHFHVPESEADQFKCNEIFFLPETSPEQDSLYNFTVIKEAFAQLAREIFSTIEAFLTKYREFSIHEVIISGGGANFQNINVMLASNLNTTVRPVGDLYTLEIAGSTADLSQKNSLAAACGAFLRE